MKKIALILCLVTSIAFGQPTPTQNVTSTPAASGGTLVSPANFWTGNAAAIFAALNGTTSILNKANGGTGTATPNLIAGNGITVTGTWPNQTISYSGGSSSGTVTNFSSGNLSPLFTTSVANSSSTPALSFSLSATSQNAFLAGPLSGSGAPSYRSIADGDLSGTTFVSTSGSYSNPSWITALAYSKLTGAPSSLPPSGTASGDLSGSYPGPTVAKINGTLMSGLGTGIIKNTTGNLQNFRISARG